MIRVEAADPRGEKWRALITASHQSSLYVLPEWMELNPCSPFLAFQGSEPAGGIVAIPGIFPSPFIPYQGLLIRKREDRETAQALLSHVERLPRPLSIWNHPSLIDIRPFTWRWHDAQTLWQHDIRYTYICDRDTRLEPRAESNVTAKPIEEVKTPDWFDEWQRQPWVEPQDADRMVKILAMDSVKVYSDGDATVVWGRDLNDRGYYLASVGRPTNVLYQLIRDHDSTDLVGCNSPQRALFKRGFGGHLRTTYAMKLVA